MPFVLNHFVCKVYWFVLSSKKKSRYCGTPCVITSKQQFKRPGFTCSLPDDMSLSSLYKALTNEPAGASCFPFRHQFDLDPCNDLSKGQVNSRRGRMLIDHSQVLH